MLALMILPTLEKSLASIYTSVRLIVHVNITRLNLDGLTERILLSRR